MTNDLIERYIYAATKRLPENTREDVSNEIRTIIDDMLTERCGNTTPTEKDIKIVLTELGTPRELYEQYNPDTDKCLIGSPYYSTYKYVLKIVLICVGAGIAVTSAISSLIGGLDSPDFTSAGNITAIFRNLFVNLFVSAPSALVWSFAFVTILFAVFYHKNVKIDNTGNLDSLPPVPSKNEKISKAEPIVGITISIAFMSVFLICPQIFGAWFTELNEWLPIFDISTIRSTWYIIVLFGILGIIRDVVKLIENRHNKKVMTTTIVTNSLTAIITVIWLSCYNLINQNFINTIVKYVNDGDTSAINIFTNLQFFLIIIILIVLAIDTIETVVKTRKSHP